MTRSTVLAAAMNGAYRSRADHPALPVTVPQVVEAAVACRAAGAGLLHLHVRDERGRHSLDAATYRAAILGIRAEVGDDLVIQVTTEAAGRFGPAEQMAVVRQVRPECASLAVRELVREPADEAPFLAFLGELAEQGSTPQFITYGVEDLRVLLRLVERPWVLLVLGTRDAPTEGAQALLPRLALLPEGVMWMVCAFGRAETGVAAAAAALGGDVRIGFENNLQRPDGSVATDNAERVRAVRALIEASGGRVAAPGEVRNALDILHRA